jgi:hypothetical protein
VWLPWQDAAVAAVVLVAALLATRSLTGRAVDASRATAREVSVVLVLYAIWQCVHELAVTHTAGAQRHATWVWHLEQRLGLPSELAVQRQALHHRAVVEFLNGYYALVHVPALGILLVWLFFGHRDRYPPVRNVLAVLTGACLVIQTIPVAPPRLRPDLGFVDTGLLLKESVYGTGGSGISNQLAAMPSVHVAWALLVAVAAITIGRSRWRWLVLAHPVLTVWAVVATGNHWWLDGIVSAGLLVAAIAGQAVVAAVWRRLGRTAPEQLVGAGGVEAVHGGIEPVGQDGLDGVGGLLLGDVELDPLRLAHAPQHVVGPLLPPRRLADADADAGEVGGVQVRLDRLEPVVACETAAELELDASEREVELVVHHDQAVGVVDAVAPYERADRQA